MDPRKERKAITLIELLMFDRVTMMVWLEEKDAGGRVGSREKETWGFEQSTMILFGTEVLLTAK
jgi:hypothetical protein